MTAQDSDELLDGLIVRDFLVLLMHALGREPRSPRNRIRLRRGPWYVIRAERRLHERGLLAHDGTLTPDGIRAARTSAVLFELDAFEPSL